MNPDATRAKPPAAGDPGPAFGAVDLTNCDQEPIHVPGSVQPHGVLVALTPELMVEAASATVEAMLGVTVDRLLGASADVLAPGLSARIAEAAAHPDAHLLPQPLPGLLTCGPKALPCDGRVHRHVDGGLVLELEPAERDGRSAAEARVVLLPAVQAALQRFGDAVAVPALCEAAAEAVRGITGHDRVMIYRFDSDGHGEVLAEARDPKLGSLVGHHYPASDIPAQARTLYLRQRVRLLVDRDYVPAPMVPAALPSTGRPLDMSLCDLRSMSPLHLQYLRNMGVASTLVASIVREGRLWGLVSCHHDAPLHVPIVQRAAVDLLAELLATRLAAIENYAQAQVAIQVRRLQQRLVEATATEGDWRLALFRQPHTLLAPLGATGAVLVNDGELLTTGDVPSTSDLRALAAWVATQLPPGPVERTFACSTVGTAHPPLARMAAAASGVLGVRLSAGSGPAGPDLLLWLRAEQVRTVNWAGDPNKPVEFGNDPMTLSPRRSFETWTQVVRGTARPWTHAEHAMARAFGNALADITVQIHAVRLLIAEHQLVRIRGTVADAGQPVLVADGKGRCLFANDALRRMTGRATITFDDLDGLAELFEDAEDIRATLVGLLGRYDPWRGTAALRRVDAAPLPVTVMAELVQGRGGTLLGFILTFTDLTQRRRAIAARARLEAALGVPPDDFADLRGPGRPAPGAQGAPAEAAGPASGLRDADPVVRAIATHARLAALDIADGGVGQDIAGVLDDLRASTRRATALYRTIRGAAGPAASDDDRG